MSDLINRSELLKAMDTWDKFGYDEHNRLIRIDSTNEEYVPYVRYEDMVNCVMNMPNASDDVCEWTSTQNNEWKPSCEPNSKYNVFGVAWFRKCPYCGKKIKVVE